MKIEQINDYLVKATSEKKFWRGDICYGHVIYDSLEEINKYQEK